MSSMSRALAVTAAVSVLAVACTKVPYTGRKQFNLIPEGQMNSIGASTYQEMLGQTQVHKGGDNVKILRTVGDRISVEANKPDYDWSYSLINEPQINAWCLPGGYIGFYDGILPVLQSEAGMAFVMGHEVGHAVAKHGAERMSQQLGVVGGLSVLELFLTGSNKVNQETKGMIMAAAGVGAQYGVLLPFSRSHEKESDIIGMMYMAGAGYPPGESIKVWQRMSELTGGSGPAFLSTHPSFSSRTDNQKEWMPEAKKRYQRNALQYDTKAARWTASVGK